MRITRHATEQMTRRRIARGDVELAISMGQELHRAGATFYVLRLRDIPPSMRHQADVRRAEGTVVVVEEDRISTVYRNRDPRHIRQKSRHARAA
jgi:hypothetical protein